MTLLPGTNMNNQENGKEDNSLLNGIPAKSCFKQNQEEKNKERGHQRYMVGTNIMYFKASNYVKNPQN